MTRTIPVTRQDQIPTDLADAPLGRLLAYHNLGRPHAAHASPELLIATCMDHRLDLRIPSDFAYVLRTPGANLQGIGFGVSFAIAVGGVRQVAVVTHTDCGMIDVARHQPKFVAGLTEAAGWDAASAEHHFAEHAPQLAIANEVDFAIQQAGQLRLRYPRLTIVPLLYRVEDRRLYLIEGDA